MHGTVSLLLIAVGGSLYAFGLGADGVGPLAVAGGGGRALTFFEGSSTWVSGTFIIASLMFGLGLVVQVVGVIRSGLLKGVMRAVVFVAALAFVGSTAIPSGWGLYAVAAAALAAYVPMGLALWRESAGERQGTIEQGT